MIKDRDNLHVQSWNLGSSCQWHLLIKRQTTPLPKLELRFLKSMSLADQKAETTPSLIQSCKLGFWSQCPLLIKDRDNPLVQSWNLGFCSQWHLLIKRQRQPLPHPTLELRFWSQCYLLTKRQRQPPSPIQSWNLHFKVSVTCWSKSRDNPPSKVELLFLKSVSLAVQKVETTLPSKVGT